MVVSPRYLIPSGIFHPLSLKEVVDPQLIICQNQREIHREKATGKKDFLYYSVVHLVDLSLLLNLLLLLAST